MGDVALLWVDPDADGVPERLAADPSVRVRRRDSVESAAAALDEHGIDCLVTAFELPDGDGTDLIARARERRPDVGCLLRTDADPERVASTDADPRVFEYVEDRPGDADELLERLVRTTARRRSQTAYPLPDREDERLAALERYDLASPVLEEPLHRITDLAARHFDAAQSSVNAVRESRQSFLACHADRWSAIPREESICTYAILSDGVTVVEDPAEDPRFAANEVLAELGIGFYAGARVTVEGDLPVGTVCVYDEHPRTFTADDEAYLRLLADEAADWIEVTRALAGDAERDRGGADDGGADGDGADGDGADGDDTGPGRNDAASDGADRGRAEPEPEDDDDREPRPAEGSPR